VDALKKKLQESIRKIEDLNKKVEIMEKTKADRKETVDYNGGGLKEVLLSPDQQNEDFNMKFERLEANQSQLDSQVTRLTISVGLIEENAVAIDQTGFKSSNRNSYKSNTCCIID